MRFLLYGANGYTGQLIAEEAARTGMRPILAGRRAETIAPIAERYGFEHRVFSLGTRAEIIRSLDGVDAVLLAAGPFSSTSAPMLDACIASGIHYLDITGEIAVFERCAAQHDRAVAARVVVLPGVGFDVVPSDCLAATLARALPNATSLELAFAGTGSGMQISRGTAKTMLEGAGEGGAIRRDGISLDGNSQHRRLHSDGSCTDSRPAICPARNAAGSDSDCSTHDRAANRAYDHGSG